VARDAKDVAVSYYHHHRLFFGYSGSSEDFFEALLAEIGKVLLFGFWGLSLSAAGAVEDAMRW
jgi:hypothetical protein